MTWGRGGFGRLGHGSLKQSDVPQVVETLRNADTVQVNASVWNHSYIGGNDTGLQQCGSLIFISPKRSGNVGRLRIRIYGGGDPGGLFVHLGRR